MVKNIPKSLYFRLVQHDISRRSTVDVDVGDVGLRTVKEEHVSLERATLLSRDFASVNFTNFWGFGCNFHDNSVDIR